MTEPHESPVRPATETAGSVADSAWLELKLAWGLHNKRPEELDTAERQRLGRIVEKQRQLETLILGSPEALGIVVSPPALQARLDEIRARYSQPEAFHADLQQLGLDESGLEQQAARDLHLEGVLERIASHAGPVTETDAEIWYRLHPAAFRQPERRTIRHILIVFDSAAERDQAARTLNDIRQQVRTADDFARQALRFSQCPTAMEGGMVGTVTAGKLYPELDAVAFCMAEGEVSAVTESEMGLHLLRCDQIHPVVELDFPGIKDRIIARLSDERRQAAQKAWIRERLQQQKG